MYRRRWLATLLLITPSLLAQQTCSTPKVRIELPEPGALVDDSTVRAEGNFGPSFDRTTVEVRIDGVDLVAALGLSLPFEGEGGIVVVRGDPITITDFTVKRSIENGVFVGPWRVSLDAAGLPEGDHVFEIRAFETNREVLLRNFSVFAVVAPFGLEAEAFVASGRTEPEPAGSEGTLQGATFGEPFAAPPVSFGDGSELRSGFVEVSEARIAGGAE